MNFAIIKKGCPACLEAMRVIPRLNLKLPPEKQIHVIDNEDWENFGLLDDSIQLKINDEDFQAYPIICIDYNLIIGSYWKESLKKYFSVLLNIERR